MPDWGGTSGPIGNQTTQDSWPIWTGHGTPGEVVEFEIDGETHSAPVNENGNWDFTPPGALSNGEHNVKIRVKDPKTGETIDVEDSTLDVSADSELRQQAYERNQQWESGGRDAWNAGTRSGTLQGGPRGTPTPVGGGGGGGGTQYGTTGGQGTTTSSGGGGGGGGGQPQSEKGNAPRG